MVITMYPGPIGGQIHSNFHGYFILASTFFNSITKWFPISAFYQCCQWITKLSPIRRKLRRLLKAAEVAETPEEVKVISYSNKSGITQAWKFSVCNCVDFMIPISLWKFALGSRPCSVNSTKEENENKDNAQKISTLSNSIRNIQKTDPWSEHCPKYWICFDFWRVNSYSFHSLLCKFVQEGGRRSSRRPTWVSQGGDDFKNHHKSRDQCFPRRRGGCLPRWEPSSPPRREPDGAVRSPKECSDQSRPGLSLLNPCFYISPPKGGGDVHRGGDQGDVRGPVRLPRGADQKGRWPRGELRGS